MNLNAGAIQFPLQESISQEIDRFFRVGRRLREHRLDRAEHACRNLFERAASSGERDLCYLAQLDARHDRAANAFRLEPSRTCDRFRHQAGRGSLTELAEEKMGEELLLRGSGAPEELAQQLLSPVLRTFSAEMRDLLENLVHLAHPEHGRGRKGV